MTSPASEKLRPSPPARYEELAQEHLDKAELALANDNALQESEEIWNAFASAIKAVCQQRGWNHRYHNHIRAAASYLAEERSRPDFHIAFGTFESLHINNYEHQRIVAEVIPILNRLGTFAGKWRKFGGRRRRTGAVSAPGSSRVWRTACGNSTVLCRRPLLLALN